MVRAIARFDRTPGSCVGHPEVRPPQVRPRLRDCQEDSLPSDFVMPGPGWVRDDRES